ncbi:MAG TPA: hypothetical protein VKS60_09265 [Stellaceae bacterium]|nr:hypothetical protein [Stellaceae bacterium]
MRSAIRRYGFVLPVLAAIAVPPGPAAGAGLSDDLLDHMVGTWHLTGTMGGKPADQRVEARWVLGHQFLMLHETASAGASGASPAYEAEPYIGWDAVSERYVAHWLDIFGGRWSETLGYGKRDGDAIAFVFEYPDGPFHTTFRWDKAQGTWQWRMEQKNKAGQWEVFADAVMRPDTEAK